MLGPPQSMLPSPQGGPSAALQQHWPAARLAKARGARERAELRRGWGKVVVRLVVAASSVGSYPLCGATQPGTVEAKEPVQV